MNLEQSINQICCELKINDLTVEGEGISKQKAEIAAAKK